jgi:A/G-specific adenine glycosylase
LGLAEELPRRPAKPLKPQRFGIVFWATARDGGVLVRRRPDRGLLGGMMEFPSTPWLEHPWDTPAATTAAPVKAVWRPLPGVVRHSFTHFDLALGVWLGTVRGSRRPGFVVTPPERFTELALPTLMKKVAAHVSRMTSRLDREGERR